MDDLKKLLILAAPLLCITNTTAFAEDFEGGAWLSIEAGVSFLEDPDNITVEPMPGVNFPDDYVNTSIDNTAIIGAALGYSFILNDIDDWFPANRIGLYYDYYFAAKTEGYINKWQSTTIYDYAFDVHSNTLWLGNQLDLIEWNYLVPFIDLGIGIAWNTAEKYSETPLPEVPNQDHRDLSAAFADQTQTSFAWRVGVGVNLALSSWYEGWNVGVLYRYADLGEAKTGASENYPTAVNSLETKLRSNELLANIRYDF
jgi:opacity protein-like surface antigen